MTGWSEKGDKGGWLGGARVGLALAGDRQVTGCVTGYVPGEGLGGNRHICLAVQVILDVSLR